MKTINGTDLERMLRFGLAKLSEREEEINRLNVFPVPDGDTGTNMRMTLENGVLRAAPTSHAGTYLHSLSEGMLFGARGNSGVILSQFFKGFYLELSRYAAIPVGALRNGLIRGYRVAYQGVVTPVEGTILTVTREGIEGIRRSITRSTSVEALFAMYVAEMKKSLEATPKKLDVLREAGVVDSGAMGFVVICEGMLAALYGQEEVPDLPESKKSDPPKVDLALFNENSVFEDGYCTEFILQLMKAENYDRRFRISAFISDLKLYGNSIVAVQDGMRVKVHVHTKRPEKIVALARNYGEFLTFKLENMQVQHNEYDRALVRPAEEIPLAVVAVANGEGLRRLYTDLGCAAVLDGGKTMNTSSQEFVDAFSSINARRIAVLPNNPNVIGAAEQAAALLGTGNVTVLPSKSHAEGYFALAMDVQDSEDVDFRIEQMKTGVQSAVTLAQTRASRDYTFHEISCKKGDEIALLNGELVCVGTSPLEVLLEGIKKIPDLEDREVCAAFYGAGVGEEERDRMEEALCEAFPLLDVELFDGGQEIYRWIIGVN